MIRQKDGDKAFEKLFKWTSINFGPRRLRMAALNKVAILKMAVVFLCEGHYICRGWVVARSVEVEKNSRFLYPVLHPKHVLVME